MRRRRLLGLTAATTAGSAAGCLSGAPTGGGGDGGGGDGEDGGGDGEGGGGDGEDGGGGEETDIDWPTGTYADYETTTVRVESPEGDELGSVTAAIADDGEKRPLGLSDAEALPEDGGMLFTYGSPRDLTFIMPNMSFGIDIVFVDGDREITRIHSAPEPGPNEDGSEQEYDGSGQYVLEVPYEWTDRHGVEVGDSLRFDL